MFSPIAISLSPNTEKDDVLLALKLLFSPWRWKEGKYIEKLEKEFAKYLGVKCAVSFNSGRAAEYIILRSLGIKKGDEILIQAFTCVVVPNSIIWLGAKPVYVDINKATFNMDPNDLEKKITPSSKAIIVQHTFGQPVELDRILKIAKKFSLLVIEDCAHSLGAKFKGNFLGAFGDASFFSFGRDKVISGVFGGMAVTNDKVLAKRLKEHQKNLPFPSFFWIFQQLFHPVVFNFLILPFYNFPFGNYMSRKAKYNFPFGNYSSQMAKYNFLNFGRGVLFLLQKLKLLSFPVGKKEKLAQKPYSFPARLPNALATLAYNQLRKLKVFNKKRDGIAKIYEKNLKELPLKLPEIESGSIFFRYTIKTKKAAKLYQFAKKRGVLLGNWYSNIIDPTGVNFEKIGYKIGSCPAAEKVSSNVINLPTHPRLTKMEVDKIIELLKEFFRDHES